MRITLQIISYLALLALFLAAVSYLSGSIEKPMLKHVMLVATLAWFASCPFWIGREKAG